MKLTKSFRVRVSHMRSNNFSKHGYQDDSAGECLYERMAPYVHCMYYSMPFSIGFLGQKFKSKYRLEMYKVKNQVNLLKRILCQGIWFDCAMCNSSSISLFELDILVSKQIVLSYSNLLTSLIILDGILD